MNHLVFGVIAASRSAAVTLKFFSSVVATVTTVPPQSATISG